jgi:hypothetical protein
MPIGGYRDDRTPPQPRPVDTAWLTDQDRAWIPHQELTPEDHVSEQATADHQSSLCGHGDHKKCDSEHRSDGHPPAICEGCGQRCGCGCHARYWRLKAASDKRDQALLLEKLAFIGTLATFVGALFACGVLLTVLGATLDWWIGWHWSLVVIFVAGLGVAVLRWRTTNGPRIMESRALDREALAATHEVYGDDQ